MTAVFDLVGHDWGGLLTGRLVSIRPERFERLDGVNHFSPYEAPGRGAALLRDFWSALLS